MNRIIEEDMRMITKENVKWNKLSNCNILVTGAYGMLPSYIVYLLVYLNETHPETNIKIYALGKNQEKLNQRFGEYVKKPYFSYIQSDLSESLSINEPLDYIVHGASYASSQYYGTKPVDTALPNTIGTYYLLEKARESNVKKFLYFSSGEIYGNVANNESIIKETDGGFLDPMDIRSCYAESKRMGESLCKSYFAQYGVPAVVARIFHTYGPTMNINGDKRVFAEFVGDVVNSRDIVIKNDGLSKRPFCYIADATTAFMRILVGGQSGEAYNVSNNRGIVSVNDLANVLISLFPERRLGIRYEARRECDDYIESANLKTGNSLVDVSKLEELGWGPRVSLEEGFRRTITSIELEKNLAPVWY